MDGVVIFLLICVGAAMFLLGAVIGACVENNGFHKHIRETVYEKDTKDGKYFGYSCSKCRKRKSAYFTTND